MARWFLIGFPVLGLIVQVWPVLHELWMTSVTYSHGYLVLGIAGWLALREVRKGMPTVGRASWLGLAFLLAAAAGTAVARAVDVQLVQQLAVPALIVGALWAGGGWRFAKRFMVPAGYLVFAMSIWGYANEPLRQMTTVVVGAAARTTGIPVYLVGNSIHIPSGTFEVEGGCSGLNYVVVGLALSVYCALVQYTRLLPRLLLIGIVLALSIVANWLRVYLIVLAGYLTEMQHFLVTVDHYYFGWVMFLLIVLPLLILSARLASGSGVQDVDIAASRSFVAPEQPKAGFDLRGAIAPAAALGIVALIVVNESSSRTVTGDYRTEIRALPAVVGDWRLEGAWTGDTLPQFQQPTVKVHGRYVANSFQVQAYAAGYAVQRQGAELIYYGNRPIPDREIVESVTRKTIVFDQNHYIIRSYRLRDYEAQHRIVWVGYKVAGFPAGSDWTGKAYQAIGALIGRTDGQVFVLSARCTDGCDAAEAALTEAAPVLVPLLFQKVDIKHHSI